MKKLTLPKKATLKDYQNYISQMVKERGFEKESVSEVFILFLEECGELAKAARKAVHIHTDKNSKEHNAGHEAADVFMYLLDICNLLNVDLEKSFREKEEINKKRVWTK